MKTKNNRKKVLIIIAILIIVSIVLVIILRKNSKKKRIADESLIQEETGDSQVMINKCSSDTAGKNPHVYPMVNMPFGTSLSGVIDTCGGNLNFRKSASTSSPVVDSIPNGTRIKILYSNIKEWYKIKYNGKEGYVHSSFIKDIKGDILDLGSGSGKLL
ncbi:MAG: SH3 domain-containing protein [Parachlamydiales bacterium]|jgi:uncharacterized protein YgiM (DUF1202 family)